MRTCRSRPLRLSGPPSLPTVRALANKTRTWHHPPVPLIDLSERDVDKWTLRLVVERGSLAFECRNCWHLSVGMVLVACWAASAAAAPAVTMMSTLLALLWQILLMLLLMSLLADPSRLYSGS